MQRVIGGLIILCLTIGCSPGIISSSLPIEEASWSLQANSAQALVDARHAEFGAYPNPRGVKSMTVSLQPDGRLCARDGTKQWCGGPIQGIPYLTVLNSKDGTTCVRVVDIYGNTVRSGCQAGEYSGDLPGDPDAGYVDGKDGVAAGTLLVINAVNASLEKIGLKTRVSIPQTSGLASFEQGDIPLGEGTCADIQDYFKHEFSDDHAGTDDYVFGPEAIHECVEHGKCRIGQLVTRAMVEACGAIPAGAQTYQFELGIVGGGGSAVGALCTEDGEVGTCVGSPLVLDLDGDGLALKGPRAGAVFSLLGSSPMDVGWVAGPGDALLACDLNGDGRIDSGRELFGEATGGWAPNGFAALARFDDNGDGVISSADPIFERLVAWRDDGDGRSAPEELVPLASLGIHRVSLSFTRSDRVDAHGNELRLVGEASGNGKPVPVIDVWFRMQGRRR